MEVLSAELVSESPLADVTLLSDGNTIYAAHSASEVVDVFRAGQGVFGIALGPVEDELAGEIHRLYPERGPVAKEATPTDQGARDRGTGS